jgi:hypothetical protein
MFLEWVQNFSDKSKLKYLDEAHFVPRHLNNRKVWGLKSKRVYTKLHSIGEKSSSVTIIVSLDPKKPVYHDIRIENNDQVFTFFVSLQTTHDFLLITSNCL